MWWSLARWVTAAMAGGEEDVKPEDVDVMTEDVDTLSLDDWKKRRTRLYQRFKKAYHKVELAISRKQATAVAAFNALEDLSLIHI